MLLKDISLNTPQENILYDEVLLHLAEEGLHGDEEILRFWESEKVFIVLGRIGKAEHDIYMKEAFKNDIPILRRSSGGGTVLQGKGCLNYTFILSKNRNRQLSDLRRSYEVILQPIIHALKRLGKDVQFFPVSDIALAQDRKKISGNSQKRGRRFILHHGTILYDFN